MVDADLIAAKLAELARRVDRVASRRPAPGSPLDEDAQDIIALNLMVAVQTCADIASHLIADEGWQPASSLGEGFVRLAEKNVIGSDVAKAMTRAVGLRNVVAHGYARVNLQALEAAATSGIDDLRAFSRDVAAWTTSHSRPT